MADDASRYVVRIALCEVWWCWDGISEPRTELQEVSRIAGSPGDTGEHGYGDCLRLRTQSTDVASGAHTIHMELPLDLPDGFLQL